MGSRLSGPWLILLIEVRTISAVVARPPIVINAMPFNRENELLDVRVNELDGVVDAFLVVESRFSQYGTPKPLYYTPHPNPRVFNTVSPWTPTTTGCSLGWNNEGKQRDYIITHGLETVYTRLGLAPSDMDILVMTDADEIPNRGAISRIRARPPLDGRIYPIRMNRYLYNFAWREKNGNQQAAYGNVASWQHWKLFGKAPTWGPPLHHGGWHCTKCFRPEEFNGRLKDYLCGDGIRWGDYEWSLGTIKSLISRGIWIGAFPHQMARRSSVSERPKSSLKIAFLNPPGYTDTFNVRMPYCGSKDPNLSRLKRAWCN